MAYTRTFAQLSLAVQQLGEWERSEDVTPGAVLLQAINYGLLEGYDHMVQKWAEYYTRMTSMTIIPGALVYDLDGVTNDDFYKLRYLEYSRETGPSPIRFVRMLPFDLEAAYSFRDDSSRVPRYRIQGGNLVLSSSPVGTINVYYIPLAPQFTDIADVTTVRFDVPTEERLVVALAVRDIRFREELDTTQIERMVERYVAMLRTAADSRDAGEPFYLDPRGPGRSIDWEDDY